MSKDKKVKEIFETEDYSKFKFIGSNRQINKRNYAKLYASMKEKQLLIPIMVNEKFEILDGQHRFSVARDLGLPVYYYIVEGADTADMKRANQVNSTWTKQDFLNSFASEGDERYCTILRICDEYSVNAATVIKVLGTIQGRNIKYLSLEFEQGTMDIDKIEEVEKFLIALEDFSEFKPYKTIQFLGAFLRLYSREEYNHEFMQQRLETRANKLIKRSTIDDYLVVLTRDIYNFGKTKRAISYDAVNKKFY